MTSPTKTEVRQPRRPESRGRDEQLQQLDDLEAENMRLRELRIEQEHALEDWRFRSASSDATLVRREVKVFMSAARCSERYACGQLGVSRASVRYVRHRGMRAELNDKILQRLLELAQEHSRWGYRRMHRALRQEGWIVNMKRVFRLYAKANLSFRR